MRNPFDVDKTDLMEHTLDHLGVRYHHRLGWQKVRCPSAFHVHGDRNPSASVNLTLGRFQCHACDLHGDGFDLMRALEELDAPEVLALFGMAGREAPSEWLL
jgi:hypothetical protein